MTNKRRVHFSPLRAASLAAALSAAGLLTAGPANAFWGIGDVTFDPTNYAELVAHGKQIMELYNSAVQQLDRLNKMQETIAQASAAYDRLTNIHLHQLADNLNPGQYMKNASGLDTIRATRAALYNLKASTTGDVSFVTGQLSRLDDLESLVGLQSVAANNAKDASTDLDVRKSSQIVAQSTSVMAALATAEEQRRQQDAIAQTQEHQQQHDMLGASAEMYHALAGKTSP